MNLTDAEIAQIQQLISERPEVQQPPFRRYMGPIATAVGVGALMLQLGSWAGDISAKVEGLSAKVESLQVQVAALRAVTNSRQTEENGEIK